MYCAGTDPREIELAPPGSAQSLCAWLRRSQLPLAWLDGQWLPAPLVAIEPQLVVAVEAAAPRYRRLRALAALDRWVRRGARPGAGRGTGVLALVSYDLWEPAGESGPAPALAAGRVDRSLCWLPSGAALWSGPAVEGERLLERWRTAPAGAAGDEPLRALGPARTSLRRAAYCAAVQSLQRSIGEGEIYQANLCQQFRCAVAGDPLELYASLRVRHLAAHSAYLEGPGFTLVSASPETFLRVEVDRTVRTWPIKGTRPRGATAVADRAAAEQLWRSDKDRAELTMIVDLLRNDLGRIALPASVRFTGIELRSLATVHHLVGGVEARLRPDVGPAAILGATFPGGSITGAPKTRAMALLRALEPVRRGHFTGSLLWFGDDGRIDSSILIRTIAVAGGEATIGAGGGVVAQSDPLAEWAESNHKARFLANALGFEPEQAH